MPRHRSPRPFLGLWRRRRALRPLHKGMLVSAALALAGATGIALAAQHQAAPGQGSPPQAGASQAAPSALSTVRAPAPSRSSDRPAGQRSPGRSPAPSGTTSPGGPPSPAAPNLPTTTVPSPSLPANVSTSVPAAPSESTVQVDRTAPVTTASTVSSDNRTWVVSLSANEPASFQCSLDGGGYAPCRTTAVFGDLAPGPHTLAARAVDRAGNADRSPARLTAQVNASPS